MRAFAGSEPAGRDPVRARHHRSMTPHRLTDPAGIRWRLYDWWHAPDRPMSRDERLKPPRAIDPGTPESTRETVLARYFVRAPRIPEDQGRPAAYLVIIAGDDPQDLSLGTLLAQLRSALKHAPRSGAAAAPATGARLAADHAWRAATYAAHPDLYTPRAEPADPPGRLLPADVGPHPPPGMRARRVRRVR